MFALIALLIALLNGPGIAPHDVLSGGPNAAPPAVTVNDVLSGGPN